MRRPLRDATLKSLLVVIVVWLSNKIGPATGGPKKASLTRAHNNTRRFLGRPEVLDVVVVKPRQWQAMADALDIVILKYDPTPGNGKGPSLVIVKNNPILGNGRGN